MLIACKPFQKLPDLATNFLSQDSSLISIRFNQLDKLLVFLYGVFASGEYWFRKLSSKFHKQNTVTFAPNEVSRPVTEVAPPMKIACFSLAFL